MSSELRDPTGFRLTGLANFRDVGGAIVEDGRRIRRGRLFRSEGLHALPADDFESLNELGVGIVCDLRSAIEREREPTRWQGSRCPDILVMEIDSDLRSGNSRLLQIIREDPTATGADRLLMEVYRTVPIRLLPYLHALFARLAENPPLPILIHCSAGKDRTGVLVAIILLALGASRDYVMGDYLLSGAFGRLLEKKVARLMTRLLGDDLSPEVVSTIAGVRQSYLETALEVIDGEFGSLHRYLAEAGVSMSLLETVKTRLLTD